MSTAATDSFPRLLGDIGGTNARFALQRGPGDTLAQQRTLACAEFPTLKDAVEHYLVEARAARPRWGAIGMASPVTSDWVSMTNHHWSFSIQQLQHELGMSRLLVLNDFTALALALPALPPSDVVKIGAGAPRPRAPIGLLGPGTGLGMSGLVPAGDGYIPLQGEGGHVTLAAFDDDEATILARLRQRHGHVSAERVLTGPGMLALYQVCAERQNKSTESLTATDVSARGLAGTDPVCVEVLNVFCIMLGTVASDLALTLGTHGGVYIGGGIVPKLGDFFARSSFRRRFETKGRYSDYLAGIPTYVIHAAYPGLLGAARALEHQEPMSLE